MPGQNIKCSWCDKPKETAVIECSSCEQCLPYCCARVSASHDVVESKSVPFYLSQSLSTDRQQAISSQDPAQCYHCHSETGSKRKKTMQCSRCNRPFHLSCTKIKKNAIAKALPCWYCNTCDPVLNPPPNHKHPADWPHFLWHLYLIPEISQTPHSQGSTPFFCLRT